MRPREFLDRVGLTWTARWWLATNAGHPVREKIVDKLMQVVNDGCPAHEVEPLRKLIAQIPPR